MSADRPVTAEDLIDAWLALPEVYGPGTPEWDRFDSLCVRADESAGESFNRISTALIDYEDLTPDERAIFDRRINGGEA